MMGPRQVDQAALFYEFSLERHVPATHLLRSIDRFVDLSDVRSHMAPFYSSTGRPSIDPELLVRMLLVGYCYGIRSERRLCEEVHLNLAYRWFCRLGLDGDVPDHSTFSKNRHGRFRDCDLLRKLFDTVVRRCMAEGLVEGAAFAVDASLIAANKQRSAAGSDDVDWEAIARTRRSVREYLDTLDEAAWGAASETVPKFISKSDPAAQWTGAHKGHAFFAYADNYLIDLKAAIIIDVEATRAIRQAEVGAARTMIERTEDRLGLCPERLAADSAYGSAEMLGWLVNERAIEPHIPVFDKSARDDGTFSREDFAYNQEADIYVCPTGKMLTSTGTPVNDGATLLYRASKHDCNACELKPRCCPKMPARRVPRSIYENARDVARDIAVPILTALGRDWPRIDISLYGEIAWRAQLGFTDLVMKLIAHRGWSAGRGENSLAAFARAARDGRISGVEFDVCLAADSDTLVVSHDPPRHVENALTLDAALSLLSPTDLELFVEVKETGLVSRVIERLVASNVARRSVVFAFAAVARSFPWEGARPVRLGIIVMYPWNLNRAVRRYAPDVLLLGWDARVWTRVAFRAWWSVFSLEQLARRHHVPVVVGIVQRMDDLHWLSRQRLYGAVADVDRTIGRSARPD